MFMEIIDERISLDNDNSTKSFPILERTREKSYFLPFDVN